VFARFMGKIAGLLRRTASAAFKPVFVNSEKTLMLAAKQACMSLRSLERVNAVHEAGFSVYSQWGEDGIIEWLLQRIPAVPPVFVEFGVEDYREANTRFLLRNRNWHGLVMDSSRENVRLLKRDPIYWRHDLTAVAAFITRDNIDELMAKNGITGEIGLLSIDLDGNDYWVWERITCIEPVLVICEYNAVFGDVHPIAVPYDEHFDRTERHHSNLYYGAGIRALELLAGRKGYRLLGSNAAGNNAFFLREDLFPRVDPLIAVKEAEPSLYRESRDSAGRLTFKRGMERYEIVKDMPVVRVDTGETVRLESLAPVYSDAWLSKMNPVAG